MSLCHTLKMSTLGSLWCGRSTDYGCKASVRTPSVPRRCLQSSSDIIRTLLPVPKPYGLRFCPAEEAASCSGRERLWWERPSMSQRRSAHLSQKVQARERAAAQKLLEAQAQWQETAGQRLLVAGEVIFVLRSLLYVMALRRCAARSSLTLGALVSRRSSLL